MLHPAPCQAAAALLPAANGYLLAYLKGLSHSNGSPRGSLPPARRLPKPQHPALQRHTVAIDHPLICQGCFCHLHCKLRVKANA